MWIEGRQKTGAKDQGSLNEEWWPANRWNRKDASGRLVDETTLSFTHDGVLAELHWDMIGATAPAEVVKALVLPDESKEPDARA